MSKYQNMKSCLAILLLLFVSFDLSAQNPATLPGDLEGNWKGSLDVQGLELPLVIHIKRDTSDELAAELDSPLQNVFGLDAGHVEPTGDSFLIAVKSIRGSLLFHFDSEKDEWQGTWEQGSARLPITLHRLPENEQGIPPRPQEPDTPLPYIVKEVTFRNETAGITLSGTLTLPDSSGHFPAVVLVSGSGPQDRDEGLLGHKPFYVLSDFLTRNGIAVLRYDDRGVGKSEGFYHIATTADFAEDARVAHAFLEQIPQVMKNCTGIVGHSEGGLIAALVANNDSTVDFIVMIAGPSIPMDSLIILQSRLINKKAGKSDDFIALNSSLQQQIFSILREAEERNDDLTSIRLAVDGAFKNLSQAEKDTLNLDEAAILQQIQFAISPWMRYILTLNPDDIFPKIKVPVLAIFGEKDLQVPPAENAKALREHMDKSPLPDYRIEIFPGLNHLMQNAKTGLPEEYSRIQETMAPKVMKLISDWILSHCKK